VGDAGGSRVMTSAREVAKAKLNLTLKVIGRRPDGFHEIESLVAFTALGDEVELEPDREFGLTIDGPFAPALGGHNLIETAAATIKAAVPEFKLGYFRLHKVLPVAAGLGGGSADAAASLRLLTEANPGMIGPRALREVASRVGSDMTACLESRPVLMTGLGEIIRPVKGMPACGVVLANPGTKLDTKSVYAALKAGPAPTQQARPQVPDFGDSFDALIDYASVRANVLEPVALNLTPAIGEVLDGLSRLKGARLVRLSGSGPTCFALFASEDEAKLAGAEFGTAHPEWWVAASAVGGSAAN
jgi:4-diphosphocytidyl-2-C-methyl-D-erythritol kinase